MMSALTYLVQFPQWWYVDKSHWWWIFASRSLLIIGNKLAFGSLLKNLFSPYHNDTTPVGRGLGVLFRLCWLFAGAVIFALAVLALTIGYIAWLLLPLGLVWGFYLGGLIIIVGLLATIGSIAYFWWAYGLQPKYTIQDYEHMQAEGPLSPDELRDFTAGSARTILKDLPTSFATGSFVKSLVTTKRMEQLFKRMELSDQQLVPRVTQASVKQSQVVSQRDLIQAAVNSAKHHNHPYITSTDLFLGLISISPAVADTLKEQGIHVADLERANAWVEAEENQKLHWRWWRDEVFHLSGGVDRGWTSGWTPTMKHLSVDITAQVASGRTPYIIGRTKEIEEVVRVLERTTKANVLLIGEPGVGKSSIVDGIAQSILQATASPTLADSKVIQLDLEAVIGNWPDPQQMEQHFVAALTELTAAKTILFIDSLEHIVARTGAGTIDLSALLVPFIESGQLKVVGATSLPAYRKYLEPQSGFISHFQTVDVAEPDLETATAILQEFAVGIEQRQGVTISLPAIQAAVELSAQYIHDHVLPEKAIDLLDEAAAAAVHNKQSSVSAEIVAEVVADKTGVPVTQVTQDEAAKLNSLEEVLHQRIVGQDAAVEAVANALRRSRAGLRDSHKPMAVFLFVGPTGTGKTELAKTIAANYFGSEDAMVRLDMSEYQDANAISKLIGASGSQTMSGQLTAAIQQRPFTVLLLDELEKAHPSILDLFLQVFDDGRLTDASGKTVQFNQSIIVATSNAGTRSIQQAISQGYATEQIQPAVKEMLAQRYFRPEFLNRFDDIVVFRQLQPQETVQIAHIMLQSVIKEAAAKEITLTVSDELVEKIALAGYDPIYGARPLRHLIQDKIENSLARQLLSGVIKKGATVELNSENTPV